MSNRDYSVTDEEIEESARDSSYSISADFAPLPRPPLRQRLARELLAARKELAELRISYETAQQTILFRENDPEGFTAAFAPLLSGKLREQRLRIERLVEFASSLISQWHSGDTQTAYEAKLRAILEEQP